MQHPEFLWRRAHVPVIHLSLLVVGALLVTYAVLFDQGRFTAGHGLLHEVFHDARHLLGIPCH